MAVKADTLIVVRLTLNFIYIFVAPLQKLISSDKLTFIPNLYYQQYRLLDSLGVLRSDYPLQKILMPKEPTKHQFLVRQMRQNHFILEQEIKYRKVIYFHLAKCAKEEFFKRKLKREEKYLFHRVAFSQLAEAVKNKIQETKVQTKVEAVKQQIKDNKRLKSKISDDIFIDNQEDSYNGLGGDQDLLGDIFNNQIVQQPQQNIQIPPPLETIENYVGKLIQQATKQKECKKILNRKYCLKKINENIRKRIKSKLNEQAGEKNLNSATVLITSLISNQNQVKPNQNSTNTQQLLIDPPAETEFLSSTQSKQKRKKQQNFELKWSKEALDQFKQRNSKFEINKNKFQSNYLATCIIKDEKEYEKTFSKNIMGKEPFPPTLNSIPNISQMFKVNPYYNTSADKQFENFVIKHNKKAKFQKFKQIASYALSDSYSSEHGPSNIAKIFLNPEGSFSQRVIYKVSGNKLISANSIHQRSNLTKQQILLLSFLVRRYLCIFGSNWVIITTLILTHPSFSSMYLSTQQIQELYQIAKNSSNQSSIDQINMMSQKMLPASLFVGCSYEQMKPNMVMQPLVEDMTEQAEQNDQRQRQREKQLKEQKLFDLNDYQKLINEQLTEHEQPQEYAFKNTALMYDQFVQNVKLPSLHEPASYLTESLSSIISQFQGKSQIKYLQPKQPAKFNQCSDWVLQKVKNQIKFNTPIRKRKNISDKSSQLVKILHLLKQRIQNPIKAINPNVKAALPASQNNPVTQPPRPTVPPAMTSSAPAPAPPTVEPTTSTIKKTLPKARLQDKKDKAGQKEPKQKKQQQKKKKKPGKDDKDADKEDASK